MIAGRFLSGIQLRRESGFFGKQPKQWESPDIVVDEDALEQAGLPYA
jgi:hypothetical protein